MSQIRPLALVAFLFLITSCTSPAAPPPATVAANQDAVHAAWQASPHGNTYALNKGPNTYCAKCHSPKNWDPAAAIDKPPNCVSCKFDSDAAPRRAAHNTLVAESDWHEINCDTCHRVSNGVASSEIAWWNQATGQYEPVTNSTALCEKCHTDTDTLRHHLDLGTSAHSGMTCTTCHDPHSAKASCTSSGCHGDVLTKAITGHDSAHKNVTCVACHDAAGLKAAPGPDGQWVVFRTTELLGQKQEEVYQSHNLQKTVDCTRCHYTGNPNGLKPIEQGK